MDCTARKIKNQDQRTIRLQAGNEEALDGTAKGDALVPKKAAAMLERKETPELSFTKWMTRTRADHPADPPELLSEVATGLCSAASIRLIFFCVEPTYLLESRRRWPCSMRTVIHLATSSLT